MGKRILLNAEEINIILNRLACQLIENHDEFKETVIIGIQPRGVFLSDRLQHLITEDYGLNKVNFGKLDITFFRDDFMRGDKVLKANKTDINFIVEDKNVVLVDDVLYTGRSIRSALTAIQSFGRPKSVELLTLIDRRFSRHLPIQPDYKGRQVDAINHERVIVSWKENDGEDAVYIIQDNNE
jgi:pyrimidine operon attenuation protein/uracil phosphoribosyltransferase